MFTSFYTGATGMKSQTESLGVTGNNIANVSTVGFKTSSVTFENLMSQTMATGGAATGHENGYSQLGLGVGLQSISTNYSQGAFLTTNTATNLAIGGKGFFQVANNGETNYTRAGNFEFNSQGYLVDPNGGQLQGRAIVNGKTSTTSSSIQLKPDANGHINMEAKATSVATVLTNLNATQASTTNAAHPYFSLTKAYNGLNSNAPLSSSQYAYNTTIKVYDAKGEAHTLSVYYDKVDTGNGQNVWQYTVTMPPGEDARAGFKGTSNAGMLMTGTLSFNSSGALESQSAFTYSGSGDPKALKNWVPSSFSAEGYPQCSAQVSNGSTLNMGINLGLTSTSKTWNSPVANAAAVGSDPSKLPTSTFTREASATTAYSGTSSTLKTAQNGYASGVLQNITVDPNGVVSGSFTNGQTQNLYQIDLYYFTNQGGLRSEGNNYYSATQASGEAKMGEPNSNGLGTLTQYSLEQSNADMATEFVTMISTQRAFEVNSKVITTSDSLIQTALNIKR